MEQFKLNTSLHHLHYISLYYILLHCILIGITVTLGLCYTFLQNCRGFHLIKGVLILLLVLHFSAYQVIVLEVVDGVEILPGNFNSKLKDWDNSNKENSNFYITAEIQNVLVVQNSWEFTVGDDKTYEGFVNKALEKGKEYDIFQRAVTRDKDVSKLTQFFILYQNSVNKGCCCCCRTYE